MYYIYRFIDKSKNIIYVGKSKQELEQRFRGHTHLPNECYNSVHKIEYIVCDTETDMNIKEIYYINKYKNENGYFNLLDLRDMPKSIEFNDKWKMYRGALPSQFSKSINYKKGYSSKSEIKYNTDGTEDKRRPNKVAGESSYVEALTKDEVNLIANYMIERINSAQNMNHRQLWYRNLMLFVIGINTPLKADTLLNLKYKDVFDKKDKPKSIELKLDRYHKDEIINIPLRSFVSDMLIIYREKFDLNYTGNCDDILFKSREHGKMTSIAWGRILKDAAVALDIRKNINTESLRKTYGTNVYKTTRNKAKALQFLGEIWGQSKEAKIIKYLNLTNGKVDFDYFFGEAFSLCDINLKKINLLDEVVTKPLTKTSTKDIKSNSTPNNSKVKKDLPPKQKKKIGTWSKELKLEIVNKYLIQNIPQKTLAEEYQIDKCNISRWVSDYRRFGEVVFDDKKIK